MVDYIHEHFSDADISVEKLAHMCKMSGTYFRKIFYSAFSTTPLKHINELRKKYALELLKSGYYTVGEAAEKCGFSNTYYFSSFIKKRNRPLTFFFRQLI